MKFFVCFASLILSLPLAGCHQNVSGPPPPGPEWIVYTRANSPIRSPHINNIAFDSDGKVWFATDTGAAALQPATGNWTIIVDSLKSGAGSSRVNVVCEAK